MNEHIKPLSRTQKRRAARKRAKARGAILGTQPEGITDTVANPLLPKPSRPLSRASVIPEHSDPYDVSQLVPTRSGTIRMRGRTDKGRRWHQEIDPALAVILVREKAAVVVNRYTIRRLFTNKGFRKYILERDRHICYFCGGYGDTIDHLLPRAKGGHTTPINCVCACMECNQSKADRDLDDFIHSGR